MIYGTFTIVFNVQYDPNQFDPSDQFQLAWRNPEDGQICDDPDVFDTEPISEEKIRPLSPLKNRNHETWKVSARIQFDEDLVDPQRDIVVCEFDQNEGCIVPDSTSMTITGVSERIFQAESVEHRERKKRKIHIAHSVPKDFIRSWKFAGLAIALIIALICGGIVGGVAAILLLIRNVRGEFMFVAAVISFLLGSLLGLHGGGWLIQRTGIATHGEVEYVRNKLMRRRGF